MSDVLILLLGASPDEPLRWGAVEDDRLMDCGVAEDLAALPEEARIADRIVALLPGEQAAVRRMASLPRGAAKALAAARLLMEDELGEAADGLHVVVAAGEGAARAVAVKDTLMEDWVAAFTAAGIALDSLSADFLALPSAGDAATLVSDGGRVRVACDGGGFALEEALFADLGPGLFVTAPARIVVLGDATPAHQLWGDRALDDLGPADDAKLFALHALALDGAPNLLQGRFARRRSLAPALKSWRRAGAMAAGLAATLLLVVAAEAVRADRLADRWTGFAGEVHARAFPDAAGENPAAHARRVLNEGGGASFTALSTRFAEALEENEAVVIERVRYNAGRGEFVASLASPSDAAIESFRAALAARGVEAVDHGGYRRDGGVWSGELTARLR